MTQANIPLYKQVEEYIMDKIDKKVWLPGHQLPAETDLAQKFSVSRITTKKAMEELARRGVISRKKGQGSFVSFPTGSSKTGANNIISLIIPYDSNREELFDYISGATDFLSTRRYYLSIHCTKGESLKREREYLLQLPREGIAGIIYYPLNINSELDILEPMCLDKYPIITIDKRFDSLPISSVASENYQGTYEVMSRLIGEGHKKIAFITRNRIENASSLKDRYSAYCKALKDHGIHFNVDFVITNYSAKSLNKNDGGEYLVKRLESLFEQDVTAIFIESDHQIIRAYQTLLNKGYKFPANFCITGFDNVIVPEWFNVPYISVKQNFYEIGRKAAEMMVNLIEKNDAGCAKIEIPVQVVRSREPEGDTETAAEDVLLETAR